MANFDFENMIRTEPKAMVGPIGAERVDPRIVLKDVDHDNVGAFAWINKNELMIDENYQRTQSREKVKNIAKNWSWISCGVLIVVRRKNGKHYVVEGGHRLGAAKMRSDIDAVPCLVFGGKEVKDEAIAFLDTNRCRKMVTVFESFRALLEAGDKHALEIKGMVDKAGYRLVPGGATGKTIGCTGLLINLMRDFREEFLASWPLIVAVHQNEPMRERTLSGLVYLWKATDGKIAIPRYRSKLIALGSQGLDDAAAKAAAFYTRGGAKVYAKGIAEAVNKGMRDENRIVLE